VCVNVRTRCGKDEDKSCRATALQSAKGPFFSTHAALGIKYKMYE
jgi:hypothetical protein